MNIQKHQIHSKGTSRKSFRIPNTYIFTRKKTLEKPIKRMNQNLIEDFTKTQYNKCDSTMVYNFKGVLSSTTRLQQLNTDEFLNQIKASNEKALRRFSIISQNKPMLQFRRTITLMHKKGKVKINHNDLKDMQKHKCKSYLYINSMERENKVRPRRSNSKLRKMQIAIPIWKPKKMIRSFDHFNNSIKHRNGNQTKFAGNFNKLISGRNQLQITFERCR